MAEKSTFVKCIYSLVACLWTLKHWLWSWTHADRTVFGWHFRYLTQWALTASLLYHAGTFFRRVMWRKQLHVKKMVYLFAVSACVINILVFSLYWPAFFLKPAWLGVPELSKMHNIFVHAVSPIFVFIDAVFWSKPFKKQYYRSSQAFTFFVCASYVFWLEVIVRPLGYMPYIFLQTAPFLLRYVCYSVSSVMVFTIHKVFFRHKKRASANGFGCKKPDQCTPTPLASGRLGSQDATKLDDPNGQSREQPGCVPQSYDDSVRSSTVPAGVV